MNNQLKWEKTEKNLILSSPILKTRKIFSRCKIHSRTILQYIKIASTSKANKKIWKLKKRWGVWLRTFILTNCCLHWPVVFAPCFQPPCPLSNCFYAEFPVPNSPSSPGYPRNNSQQALRLCFWSYCSPSQHQLRICSSIGLQCPGQWFSKVSLY